MTDIDWSEHYIRRGDPTKPTYYIARRQYVTTGLFARYNIIADHIRYALSNGWIPVVDMQNYPNPYLAPEKLGKENSWEYYFEQPMRIGLAEAYSGANIILSNGNLAKNPQAFMDMAFFENKNYILTERRMLVKWNLLKVKPALMEEIAAMRQKLFAPNDRVLGVLLRGTDYLVRRMRDHPIPPPIEFAASIVAEKLRDWQCNKIFLATEDKSIVQAFKQVFRDLCVTYDREYVDYNPRRDISTALSRIDRLNDHYLQGKEYLTQMLLLTTCNSFVAARCGGSTGVMMMTDKFEHTYFFNLGKYGIIGLT